MQHDFSLLNRERMVAIDAADLIPFGPGRFLVWSLSATAGLVTLSALAAATIDPEASRFALRSLYWIVSVDGERNIPTFFSFMLLAFAATLLALHARLATLRGDRWWRKWALLAGVFVALAFDEAAEVHNLLTGPIRYELGTDGVLHFAWIIAVAPLVALLAFSLVGFLLAQPRRIAVWMILSGAVYVSGSLGMEMVNGVLAGNEEGYGAPGYLVGVTVEETLEMVGLTLFCAALLAALRRRPHPLTA